MTGTDRVIVHVGAPKCGSSSIQKALSHRPDFADGNGRACRYVCVQPSGQLLTGAGVTARAGISASGAAKSASLSKIEPGALGRAGAGLARIADAGTLPILSSEGWARQHGQIAASGLLDKIGGAHVVLFVRPPVDWLNSAWWQWGVWTGMPQDKFVRRNLKTLDWAATARAWQAVPGVNRVTVALADDVTARFFALLDAPAPDIARSNTGTPAAFLMFLTRNRVFRKDLHDSRTEFVVAAALPARRWPTPWMLGPDHVRKVLRKLAPAHAALAGMLSPADRAAFDADPRWHTPAAYGHRQVDDLGQYETVEALSDLAALLAEAQGDDPARARREIATAGRGGTFRLADADAIIAGRVGKMQRAYMRGAAKSAPDSLLWRLIRWVT